MGNDPLDEELVHGLKIAKTKRCRFAFVVKGGADGALLVTKQKVPPVLITLAKKKCGGSGVVKGAVFYEEGTYVFETAKPPAATLAKALKLVAKRDAGLTIKVDCRQGTDPDLIEDGEEPQEVPVAPPQAPPKDPAAAYQARVSALAENLKKAILTKSEAGNEAKLRFSESQVFSRKKDFERAMSLLIVVEDEIQKALSAAPGTDGAKSKDPAAAYQARVAALTDNLKKAILTKTEAGNEAKLRFSESQLFSRKKDYERATSLLKVVEEEIAKALNGNARAGQPNKALEKAYNIRVKAITEDLKRALTTGSPAAQEAKLRFSESQVFSRKQNFQEALRLLDAVEEACQQALSGGGGEGRGGTSDQPKESGKKPTNGNPEVAKLQTAYNNRVKGLTADLKAALKTGTPAGDEAKLRFSESQLFSRKQNFEEASRLLELVEDQIKQALGKSDGETISFEALRTFRAKWKEARAEWQEASEDVDGQIESLRKTLLSKNDPDLKQIAEFGLNGITGNHKVPLMAAIVELDGATAANLKAKAAKVRAAAKALHDHLKGPAKDQVAACDRNPYGVDMSLEDLLLPALTEMDKFLATAGAG